MFILGTFQTKGKVAVLRPWIEPASPQLLLRPVQAHVQRLDQSGGNLLQTQAERQVRETRETAAATRAPPHTIPPPGADPLRRLLHECGPGELHQSETGTGDGTTGGRGWTGRR